METVISREEARGALSLSWLFRKSPLEEQEEAINYLAGGGYKLSDKETEGKIRVLIDSLQNL